MLKEWRDIPCVEFQEGRSRRRFGIVADKWMIRKRRNGSWAAVPPWWSCIGVPVKAKEFDTLLRLVTDLAKRERVGEDKRSLREELKVHQKREEYLAR